ncbi:MAG: beta-N-acetylhexosaminidase [Gemmatimonadota bacterium]
MNGPVVVDLAGPELTPAERTRLTHPRVGMVILFARNYASSEQLRALCDEIHALRTPPLLIAVDHEGGRVQRFRRAPFTAVPAMEALGRLWDRDVMLACRVAVSTGFVMGAELRAHGVDLTFAPVLDLDWSRSSVIGDRALHGDARVVAMLANHLCHGLALAGMANCGKHFPGHGWPRADSHVDVPVDERALQAILDADAAPYRWLGTSLASVMPAHVVYPQIDSMPAGFSRRWLQQILRQQLGFNGAVFSDDLSMEGARVAGSYAARAQAALDAGCDFVIVCNDAAGAEQVLEAVRWKRSAAFDERLTRLAPRGPALTVDQLQAAATYRAALADVESLQT